MLPHKTIKTLMVLFMLACNLSLAGQDSGMVKKEQVQPVDLNDLFRKIFKKKKAAETKPRKAGFAILPSFGYNPSFGLVIGAKLAGGRQFGIPENTGYSTFSVGAIYTSKGIISGQVRHNIFVAKNKWNWQGQWQVARYGLLDYGIGTGNSGYQSEGFALNEYSTKNTDSTFPIKYGYVRFSEKAYRKVGENLYFGAGIRLDFYSKIADEKQATGFNTPHQLYSLRHDFNPEKYSANGFILAMQYNTREHPVRSYGGIYTDLGFQFNQKWMGSTKPAVQLQYDFRKYWSISKKNPEHVIAIWHWAMYKLRGDLPYLNMPSTASDTYGQSGRAYTFSRFKGPSYAYFETEWRFPITKNKLISGVTFLNFQTASDDLDKKVFESWEPGAGVGLRILFQKQNRTALSLDLGKGRYGANGLFSGLGEVF